ncbi:MAG: purine-nucleoside phosphorylase [Planctomycetota bacterium]|jgi:purine-nucleoside phosphorylase|nr:purine-nucleoside phosphorylase [Planctomycetota bacterium]
MAPLSQQLDESTVAIRDVNSLQPRVGLILGSGLGSLATRIKEEDPQATTLPYDQIPHFPSSTVEGHAGELILGTLNGTPLALMAGRFHYYEGYPLERVVYPVRVLGRLGITQLIVTNAAGGITPEQSPGCLMLIRDHINMLGANPLRGNNPEDLGPRFPDMTEAYSGRLRTLAREVAAKQALSIGEGVYAASLGPSYETPAEIELLARSGANAVGMSTVPEVIAARHMEIEVLGISCISNHAAGISPHPLTHDEVMETGREAAPAFEKLILGVLAQL